MLWIWGGVLLVLLFVYNFIAFELIGQLLEVKKAKYIRILLLGLVNAGLVFVLSLTESGSTPAAYVGIYLMLLAETWLLYRADIRKNLFLAVTFMLHIMTLHTVVSAVVAWAKGLSLYELTENDRTLYFTFSLTLSVLIVATLLVRFLLPLGKVRNVLQNANQRMFQTIWMSICVLYLLYNSQIYQQNIAMGSFFYVDQIWKCLALLLGGYVMLLYNFRVSELLRYKGKSEDLTSQLNTNTGFLEVLTENAQHRFEFNVTEDVFRYGLPDGGSLAEKKWLSFTKEFPLVAQHYLVAEDLPGFLKQMSREKLLENFCQSNRKFWLDYRVGSSKATSRWHRMHISLIEEEETGAALALAYTLDVHEEYEEKRRLYEQVQLDMMTGVYNRDTFESLVTEELARGQGILLMADIDNFKTVNDRLGHDKGDEILRQVAQLLKNGFRTDDIVGRFGGDEFMVYIKSSRLAGHILQQVEAIQKRAEIVLEGPGGERLVSTLSIGLVEIPGPGLPFATVYKQADLALYRSKNMGKNLYSIYQSEEACRLDGACPKD